MKYVILEIIPSTSKRETGNILQIQALKLNELKLIDRFDYRLDIPLNNPKESVFKHLNLEYSQDVFDKIINKYNLEPSNHLVDLLYEAIIYENSKGE